MRNTLFMALWLVASIGYGDDFKIDFLADSRSKEGKVFVRGDVDMPLINDDGDQRFHATSPGARVAFATAAALARNNQGRSVVAKMYDCRSGVGEGVELLFELFEQDGEDYLAARLNDDSVLVWRKPFGNSLPLVSYSTI